MSSTTGVYGSPSRVEIVRDAAGTIHIARTIATLTECGKVDVLLDTTVTINDFADSDPLAYCRGCFRDMPPGECE